MKKYRVYIDGVEVKGLIDAAGHNQAEKKAKKKYKADVDSGKSVDVEYTEV